MKKRKTSITLITSVPFQLYGVYFAISVCPFELSKCQLLSSQTSARQESMEIVSTNTCLIFSLHLWIKAMNRWNWIYGFMAFQSFALRFKNSVVKSLLLNADLFTRWRPLFCILLKGPAVTFKPQQVDREDLARRTQHTCINHSLSPWTTLWASYKRTEAPVIIPEWGDGAAPGDPARAGPADWRAQTGELGPEEEDREPGDLSGGGGGAETRWVRVSPAWWWWCVQGRWSPYQSG